MATWFRCTVAGASTDPCSKFYQGPSSASELETKALQAAAGRLGPTLLTSIHIHTYGQKWLIPWGATHPDGSCVYAVDHQDMVSSFVFSSFFHRIAFLCKNFVFFKTILCQNNKHVRRLYVKMVMISFLICSLIFVCVLKI